MFTRKRDSTKRNGVSYNNDDFGLKIFEMYHLSGEIDIPFIDALYKDYKNKEKSK